MKNQKSSIWQKKNVKWILLIEMIFMSVYALAVVTGFSAQELVFEEDEMQLKNYDNGMADGNYLDISYTDAEAVVTPAFRLQRGIYYIEAVYERHGIVKAGLLYDVARNGKELVDDFEFTLNPDKQVISYRVNVCDDSKLRFELRLTGDAVEGDYIRLSKVRIAASKLTYIQHIFMLIFCLVLIDLISWGYIRYYTKWEADRKITFLVLVTTVFFTGLPLYQSGLNNGADLAFHLSRLEGIYKGLRFSDGGFQFPVRIQPGWLDGYGYAVSVFYGDIFMYFPALLRAVGFSLEDAYKAYLEIVNAASVFISFYSFRRMTRNDISALAGSILYAGGMRITLLYSAMLGGAGGMTFYPLIVAGFYLLFTEDVNSKEYRKIWILLTFGFTGILMTHMISCLMVGLYSVLLCCIMLKKVLRRNTLRELFKAAAAAVLLNLWYLIPLLQYMLHEKLRINSNIAKTAHIEDYYAALKDFTQAGKNLYHLFTDYDALGFSMIMILTLYLITIPIQGNGIQVKRCRIFALFTLFTIIVCTDLFPFVALAKRSRLLTKFCQTIQYQHRLMSVAAVMAACLAALFLTLHMFEKKIQYYIVGALCLVTLCQNLQYFTTLSFDAIYLDGIALESRINKDPYSYMIGNGEYLPATTRTTELTIEIEYGEQLMVDQVIRNDLSFEMHVENRSAKKETILLPLLYYGGYASRDRESNERLETSSGDNGRVAVTIPPGYNGTFKVAFHEPVMWRISEVVSLVTLAVLIVLICRSSRKCFDSALPLTSDNG